MGGRFCKRQSSFGRALRDVDHGAAGAAHSCEARSQNYEAGLSAIAAHPSVRALGQKRGLESDRRHRILEKNAILGLADGVDLSADQPDAMLGKDP